MIYLFLFYVLFSTVLKCLVKDSSGSFNVSYPRHLVGRLVGRLLPMPSSICHLVRRLVGRNLPFPILDRQRPENMSHFV